MTKIHRSSLLWLEEKIFLTRDITMTVIPVCQHGLVQFLAPYGDGHHYHSRPFLQYGMIVNVVAKEENI